jgi:hypothetical protein
MIVLEVLVLLSSLIISTSFYKKSINTKNTFILHLNRIFADITECSNDNLLALKEDDYRCQHIKNVLILLLLSSYTLFLSLL